MNNEYEKQLNTLKDIKLSTIEKTEMRDSLVHFMAAHPHINTSPVSRFFAREKFILSPYSGISIHMTKILAFSFIGLLFTGGSLTMASANSIPGELLYPIKINIQEPIEGAGKTKPKDKLEWQTKKLGRRLNEIQKLSEKKDITKEEVVIAQAVLKEHVQDLTKTINTLKDDGDAGGLILSSSAELLSLSETLHTTQTVLSAVETKVDTTTNTETTTQNTTDTNTIDTNTDHTITTSTDTEKKETADISTITETTGQQELKEILNNEVDKQLIDIKKTVETVAQDTEKKDALVDDKVSTEDTKNTIEKTDVSPLGDLTKDTAHNPLTLTPEQRAELLKATDKKIDPAHNTAKKWIPTTTKK